MYKREWHVRAQLLSHVQLFVIPWAVAHQVSLSTEFFKKESWSGLPFPTPGDLLTQGWTPRLLGLLRWQTDSFTTVPSGKLKKSE